MVGLANQVQRHDFVAWVGLAVQLPVGAIGIMVFALLRDRVLVRL